jgi:hypothetical protein
MRAVTRLPEYLAASHANAALRVPREMFEIVGAVDQKKVQCQAKTAQS